MMHTRLTTFASARLAAALSLAALCAWAAQPALAQAAAARVIVTLKPGSSVARAHVLSAGQTRGEVASAVQARAQALGARLGLALTAGAAISEQRQVIMASGIDAQALASKLAADPQVESAVVDHRRRALLQPNDPLFAHGPANGRGPDVGQWYLRGPSVEWPSAVNAEAAWDQVVGKSSVVVAVLDTGVLPSHPDLAGRLLPGYDMVSDATIANDGNGRDPDPTDPGDWISAAENSGAGVLNGCGVSDSSWHGTKVAGIVGAAGNNGIGMAGTAFGVQVLPVRVLGKCGGYDSDIQAGLRWAAGLDVPGVPRNANPARIINMSLGGSGTCDAASGYPQVINEVRAAGTLVIAAAGNSAGHAVELPANCPGVVAVAGLRNAGSKVGYSDLGPEIAISAPAGNCVNIGENDPCLYPILSSTNSGLTSALPGSGMTWTDSYNYSAGTSFAAPIVAGAAALMLSAQPQLQSDELLQLLQASARAFPTSGAGVDEDGAAIPQCHAPDGTDQLQCYCQVGLCGAGMLDAAAAVNAALGPVARITEVLPQVAADTLTLNAASSLVGGGRTITAYAWQLVGSNPAVSGFVGGTSASEATLQVQGSGTVTVQLSITDDRGQQSSTQQSFAVAPTFSGGSGGGASSVLWVALLALAVAALQHARWRERRSAAREFKA